MDAKKGMSQTLALIVAASVLMMTALTVIFLAQGSLGDFGETSNQNACLGALESKCAAQGTADVSTPAACLEDGSVPPAFESAWTNRHSGNFRGGSSSSTNLGNSQANCPAS